MKFSGRFFVFDEEITRGWKEKKKEIENIEEEKMDKKEKGRRSCVSRFFLEGEHPLASLD